MPFCEALQFCDERLSCRAVVIPPNLGARQHVYDLVEKMLHHKGHDCASVDQNDDSTE